MVEPRSYKAATEVRFFHEAPLNGAVSVTVNTTDCDSVNMGSIPIQHPKLADSTGVRRRLINSGDWLDGLERLGS